MRHGSRSSFCSDAVRNGVRRIRGQRWIDASVRAQRRPGIGSLRWLPSAPAYVSGIFARFLRASLLGELKADYVRTARSKG